MSKKFELTGLGNAIVDIIAKGDDAFLAEHNIIKGAMNLIETDRARMLYAAIGPATEVSGGSAGNTMAGFASFGGKGAYLGKVANDQLGDIFEHDMRAGGIHYDVPRLIGGAETARSMIIVTPDAQRSMNTYLGASVEFSESDVNEDTIQNSGMIYLEGYLFDKPEAKKAYQKATRLAHAAGGKVSLTLSDTFCVERHRDDFLRLIESETDIVFANEHELMALYQTQSLEDAMNAIRGKCDICAITQAENGSTIVTPTDTYKVDCQPADQVVDSTGAGDQYAAGFLFGLARGYDLPTCGNLASLAAAEVISHIGPRPAVSLSALAQTHLGLKLAA